MTEHTKYGFIGLGQMGHGMAKNLRQKIRNSDTLYTYDINREVLAKFKEEFGGVGDVVIANSPREIGEVCDIVLTSVPKAPHVREVFLNPETGLLAATPRGSGSGSGVLYLELSTIDANVSSEISKLVEAGGFGEFVDAPCSGGSMGAEKGTLSFMVGCRAPLYERVLSILSHMGPESSIFHCGSSGTGLKTKLLNNYLSSITTLATAETINMGIRAGLDAFKLNAVLNASSGMSFNSKVNNPVPGLTPGSPASNGYKPGFAIEMCLGVLELAVQAGEEVGGKMVLGGPTLEAYRVVAEEERFRGLDAKVVYRWIAEEGVDGDGEKGANGVP
ncbi:NAD binding domain of 6-phosphogluconate dehydrogenase-domain-containing protein [Aspergillus carlsbadensis]|nr:NAD binding domain of 6-phosphogluconate dehydrogenase-domain-containing protein [Aspergillus carlsbadensis]